MFAVNLEVDGPVPARFEWRRPLCGAAAPDRRGTLLPGETLLWIEKNRDLTGNVGGINASLDDLVGSRSSELTSSRAIDPRFNHQDSMSLGSRARGGRLRL